MIPTGMAALLWIWWNFESYQQLKCRTQLRVVVKNADFEI